MMNKWGLFWKYYDREGLLRFIYKKRRWFKKKYKVKYENGKNKVIKKIVCV